MRFIRSRDRYSRLLREAGFTLVELIAVMIILGLLGSVVTIGISGQIKRARTQTTNTQISQIGQAISTFHLDCGFYPTSIQDLLTEPTSRVCKGFTAGGYLEAKGAAAREIPTDPWGNPYGYSAPGVHNPESYDLWSYGADGEDGTPDDISNWSTEAEGQSES